MRVPARLLPPLALAALAAGLAAWQGRVPASGWPLLADFALAGFALGALLQALGTRALAGRGPGRLLAGGGAALGLALAHFTLAPPAPALILIVIDCLSADRFTPALMPRTLAAAGDSWGFTDARAQSSWTRSAVPSLLTGTYPSRHGLYRLSPEPDRLREGVETIAEVFDRAGWATAAFIDQAQLDPAFGLAAGYHRYGFRDGAAPQLQAKFLRWHRPFRLVPRLAYLHYLDIHKPYLPDPAYLGEALPSPELALGPDGDWAGLMRAINGGERVMGPGDWRSLELLHEAEIRQLDASLGALLEGLDADGTLGAAWLVITSDHGEAFGEHGLFTHGGPPYEELLHVPLLIRPPGGLSEGRSVDAPIQQVDIAPTLLSLMGLPPLSGASGRDLSPALRGRSVPAAPSFAEFFARDDYLLSARDGVWKYMRGGGRERLFRLDEDPGEHDDVAGEYPGELERLRNISAHFLQVSTAGGDVAAIPWGRAGERVLPWPAVEAGAGAQPEAESVEALRALGYLE